MKKSKLETIFGWKLQVMLEWSYYPPVTITASRAPNTVCGTVIPGMELLFSLAEAAAEEAPRNGGGGRGTGSAWLSPAPRPPCCCCPRSRLTSPAYARCPQPPPAPASPWCRGRGRTWCTSHCRSCAPPEPRTTGPAIKIFRPKIECLYKVIEEIWHSSASPIFVVML